MTTRPRIGLVVNPIAGIGGRVGLKGSDGEAVVEQALALGARPLATGRATEALVSLHARWPSDEAEPAILTPRHAMGADAVRAAGLTPVIIDVPIASTTTAADTRRSVTVLAANRVDLLLFAGGDGTARDVAAVVGDRIAALGIPAGAKMFSAVFATSPAAAGAAAADFVLRSGRTTTEREVLDLDEDRYRAGEVAPRLFAYLRVPSDEPHVQSAKAPSALSEDGASEAIAVDVVERMDRGTRYVLGPGSTVRAIADRLGVAKTLVGIDVVADGCIVAADVGERELLALVGSGSILVVTPIGGQGFLFGRGNQPFTPSVLRAIGKERIVVIATPAKLAALGHRPLLVDTGDHELDRALAGYIQVISGYRERTVVRVDAA